MSYCDLFDEYNQKGITYVIPRRYDSLPESIMEGSEDIDILIKSNQFQTAIDSSKSLGFSPEKDSGPSQLRLYRMALNKPGKAIKKMALEPKESIKRSINGIKFDYDNPRHQSTQLIRGSQLIDLRNNLAYTSPMNGTRIPVDPSVTEGILDRRKKQNCFFIPTEVDELAHLVPHCIFNKDGEFSPYYANRCENLLNSVCSDEEQLGLLKELLDEIFFEASTLVFELMIESRYSEIREELKSYSEY